MLGEKRRRQISPFSAYTYIQKLKFALKRFIKRKEKNIKAFSIFSVTRRSRSEGSERVTESLSEWTFADLTDVTLVSDDTF